MKNKGQVYPSDSLSILSLLPAAILALTAVLSVEEQEVLAYMITRSINSTTFSKTKKNKSSNTHNPPLFHCECFHCYTTYWFRWDSSPNRELIHQAIEAFEDHLNNHQKSKRKGKKRDKTGRRTQTPPPEVDQSAAEVELQSQSEVTVGVDGAVTAVSVSQQKGLARRVLPDVLGLLNSRWWSLWSPNV